jgi:exodeoxyribonuclease VII small subunit
MARPKSTPDKVSPPLPNFEEALQGLESIVEAMEHQHLALEELVSYYEKGSTLLNRCESILKSARTRIDLITLQHQDEIELDAAVKSSNLPADEDEDEDDDDDDDNDIRLF